MFQTKQSKGFGFVYFESVEDATAARDGLNQTVTITQFVYARTIIASDNMYLPWLCVVCLMYQLIDNRKVRVDYSLTQKPHEPTPGKYLGPRGERRDDRNGGGGRRGTNTQQLLPLYLFTSVLSFH